VTVGRLHRHLARQLRKLGLSESGAPDAQAWAEFLQGVDRTYQETDLERYTLERSVGLFEREMRDLNASLEGERDRMRIIFERAPVGIFRSEADGGITLVNPALERMLGYPADQLTNRSAFELIHPEERASAEEDLVRLWSGTGDTHLTARRFIHRDGTTVYTNISLSCARDSENRPLFSIAVVEDVTERTCLEIELRHAQKLESVGRLAAGIAHELNTPIQFVGDNLAFLQSAFLDLVALCGVYEEVLAPLRSGLSADHAQRLEDAEAQADMEYVRTHSGSAFGATQHGVGRVSAIVKAMRSFAHPDGGQKTLADLNEAVRNTLVVGANELKYVAEVETSFGDLPLIACHLGDLNQVILNLLVNAAHAIADVVGETGDKGRIRVSTYREDQGIVIAIADSGTGIPEAIRQRIFDPFFTTKEVGRGTGQGLSISRSVVERHGGTLTFETAMGRGTTFFLRLPDRSAITAPIVLAAS